MRDRALLGVMVYTFARVSAVLELDVGDYFQVGRRMWFRFTEKGGRHHEMPAHHTLWSTTWRRIGRGSNLTRWGADSAVGPSVTRS